VPVSGRHIAERRDCLVKPIRHGGGHWQPRWFNEKQVHTGKRKGVCSMLLHGSLSERHLRNLPMPISQIRYHLRDSQFNQGLIAWAGTQTISKIPRSERSPASDKVSYASLLCAQSKFTFVLGPSP